MEIKIISFSKTEFSGFCLFFIAVVVLFCFKEESDILPLIIILQN